jgi:hypothetical protein
MNESEWTTVTKKSSSKQANRRRRQRPHQQASRDVSPPSSASSLDITTLQALLDKSIKMLLLSDLWKRLKEILSSTEPDSIVCYGIGNFGASSSHSAPMWQLACAMAMRDHFCSKKTESSLFYFDPSMTPHECAFLKHLKVSVLTENERGKRRLDDESSNHNMTQTLFFMPHCPLKLYTNLYETNWQQLNRLIVFGNSMSAYASRLEVTKSIRLLQTLQPYWKEEPISFTPEDIDNMPGYFENAFNDSYITSFPKPSDGWPAKPEIDFEDDHPEVF